MVKLNIEYEDGAQWLSKEATVRECKARSKVKTLMTTVKLMWKGGGGATIP